MAPDPAEGFFDPIRLRVGRGAWAAAFIGVSAWVWLGLQVGALVGYRDAGGLVAFWTAIAAALGAFWRSRAEVVGLAPRAVVLAVAASGLGATLLVAARLLRGGPSSEWTGPLGLVLLVLPLGWLANRVVFGRAPERDVDALDE